MPHFSPRRARSLNVAALAAVAALSCSGKIGPGTDGSIGNGPPIDSFTASPAMMPAGGGMTTLSWSVSGADQLVIDPGVGPVTGSSVQVPVTSTTIFTLSASNAKGISTKSVLVTVGADSTKPVILSFTAADPQLPAGGGQTTLSWQVVNADSISIDQGVGVASGDSTMVSVTATTIFTLTATNADGTTTATTAVVIGQNPAQSASGQRATSMVAPVGSETFIAPATLRMVVSAHDAGSFVNTPTPGHGGCASKVQFFVDDQVVLEQTSDAAEYWVFKGFVNGVPAGTHRVWARGIYVNPSEIYDSVPVLVTVADAPSYGKTIDLSADVVVGSDGYEVVGTADSRVRLNGNGFTIKSDSSGTVGPLTLKFVDVFDLGNRADTTKPGMNVATSATVTIEDSTFDTSNTIKITPGGAATASIRRNLFRSNMRMQINQLPETSSPALSFSGTSTGDKVFAGNNIGAGWVEFVLAKNWTVGGDTDADSNIVIGPRVGIYVLMSSNMQVRRNFSHHIYYGGWSQGANYQLQMTPDMTVEHNVIWGSSWPVQGVGCEFRYNLILDAGHQWLWADTSGGYVHHNVMVGGEYDVGGIYALYQVQNYRIINNTLDGQGSTSAGPLIYDQSGDLTVSSNLFMNSPKGPTVSIGTGSVAGDYNLFSNTMGQSYSDGRNPAHDADADAMLAAAPSKVWDLDQDSVWKRSLSVSNVLKTYRMRYAPKPGSPVIDAGDPAGGSGNDIGAIGGGEQNANDKFGVF